MATTTQNGFSGLDGAALSNHLGIALAEQLDRFVRRLLSRAALPSNDTLAGPSLMQLSPDLSNEINRA